MRNEWRGQIPKKCDGVVKYLRSVTLMKQRPFCPSISIEPITFEHERRQRHLWLNKDEDGKQKIGDSSYTVYRRVRLLLLVYSCNCCCARRWIFLSSVCLWSSAALPSIVVIGLSYSSLLKYIEKVTAKRLLVNNLVLAILEPLNECNW